MNTLYKISMLILLTCLLSSCQNENISVDKNYDSKIKAELIQDLKEKADENDGVYKDLAPVERMERLNIDIEVLDKVDTEGLIDLCLENSFYGIPIAYDDTVRGLDYFAEYFNPVKVLLTRDDAEYYVKARLEEEKDGEDNIVRHTFLETLLKKLSLNNE